MSFYKCLLFLDQIFFELFTKIKQLIVIDDTYTVPVELFLLRTNFYWTFN